MQNTDLDIYENLQTTGKMGALLKLMQTYRPNISRNTIRLALLAGSTTPLRKKIVETAEKLVAETQIQEFDTTEA